MIKIDWEGTRDPDVPVSAPIIVDQDPDWIKRLYPASEYQGVTTQLRAFDEAKHKRGGKGTHEGGRFVKGAGHALDPKQPVKGTIVEGANTSKPSATDVPGRESPLDLARKAASGGFSYHTHPAFTPTEGFFVAPSQDNERIINGPARPEDIARYINNNAHLLMDPNNFVGAWSDGGKTYLDISTRSVTLEGAMKTAAAGNQLAVFNLKDKLTHYSDGHVEGDPKAVAAWEKEHPDKTKHAWSIARKGEPAAPSDPNKLPEPEKPAVPRDIEPIVEALKKGEEVDLDHAKFVGMVDASVTTGVKLNLAPVKLDHDAVFAGLGIDRINMPQIPPEDVPKFLDELRAKGVEVEQGVQADPKTLRASQSELDSLKTGGIARTHPEVLQRGDGILVTKDGYVIDGHHRWTAALVLDKPIKVTRISMPIRQVLEESNAFCKRNGLAAQSFSERR